ncbi:MAG: TetR family transcriptional regulator [Actinobacteria bacterium]|nr:MAG: TetR family transcriptional regulator [Actinomycetota bacterium]
MGRRERKKLQTRQLLADTARRLFAERGFEAVSVAEVAREADVAEATVFNYFPTKEDLVYSGLESFENELLAAIRDRPSGETILQAFGRFVREPRGYLAARDRQSAQRLLEISRMIAQSPALLAREQQVFARYTASLTSLIANETGATDDDPRPAVAAHALIGVHRALIDHVRRHILAGEDDLPRLARSARAATRKALALLEQGLRAYGTKPE